MNFKIALRKLLCALHKIKNTLRLLSGTLHDLKQESQTQIFLTTKQKVLINPQYIKGQKSRKHIKTQ